MSNQHQTIAVLDYGSQYSQLICRRVREAQVYAELISWDQADERLSTMNLAGIILSGGPNSVYEAGAPTLPDSVLAAGVPVLGICYGLQLLAHHMGGRVVLGNEREFGPATITVTGTDALFANLPTEQLVWMSHGDRLEALPTGFVSVAHSGNSPLAAIVNSARQIYAIQFHPEVVHTVHGSALLSNFVHQICGCGRDWTPQNFITETVAAIQAQVGPTGHVICGLSGGVDSAVAATLVHRAVGDRLACIFVDHGMMRLNEGPQVVDTFEKHQGMHLVAVDAKEEFLCDLEGVTEMERTEQSVTLEVRENLPQVLTIAAQHNIQNIETHNVSLEEIFLDYYGKGNGGNNHA